ncbi:fumarylacetoacetate hydrolase family protein [Nocardioides panacihumi]|uniref:Fumarylacetoacetate hydrolase family protein n=1 Tax=Nocardioides panacihumi TaxID=400774 RepID=A0ABN2RFC5_9ACTN
MSEPIAPAEAASLLRTARLERRTLDPLTDTWTDLDEAWGYAVQAIDRDERTTAGDALVGAKLGLTSAAKQERMHVDRPIVGFLTASMQVHPRELGKTLADWAQPRIEPEIAFVTACDIARALDDDEVAGAVASVGVAAEIIDSRWTGYRFRLPDVVADNTSAAGFLLGTDPVSLQEAGDLADLRCTVTVDGALVHEATGAAILGHPLRALRLLSEHLERHGRTLPAGSLVLAGALTDAVPLTAGHDYRFAIDGLGTIMVPTHPASKA